MNTGRFISLLGAAVLLTFSVFGAANAAGWQKIESGITVELPNGQLSLSVYGENAIRVHFVPAKQIEPTTRLVVVAEPEKSGNWSAEESDGKVALVTPAVRAEVSLDSGAVAFFDKDGAPILREAEGGRKLEPAKALNEDVYHAEQRWAVTPDEGLYGLGQYQTGDMNWRGKTISIFQDNMVSVVPFMLSTNGYGILWDNYSLSEFHDNTEGAALWSEAADSVDYYFVYGPEPDEIIAGYRKLTGQAPMFAKWAYGYFQSRERYINSAVLVDVVEEYRRRKLPLDVIVLDWRWWGDDLHWSGMEWDPEDWPDPKGSIDKLHNELNARLMISVWPKFGKETKLHESLLQKGLLYLPESNAASYVHDAYSDEARKIVWDYANRGVFSKGVDAWWMDGTEPEMGGGATMGDSIKLAGKTALGSMARYLNAYSLMTTKGYYEGQRATTSDKRVFILTRSGFTGQQRNAAVTWSGDIRATWGVFAKQIPAGLNFGMAGVPYWTTDIGAFFVDYGHGSQNPLYRELYVRWYQFGAFCPIFRSHGTSTPREIWRFGEPGDWAYDALAKFDRLRYRMMPYIYSLAWRVTDDGYTIMRGLPMDFRGDPNVYNIDDQYMFGPAFLVSPVTEEMYNREKLKPSQKILREQGVSVTGKFFHVDEVQNWKLYLPAGAEWYDFWTGERTDGGQTIERPAPIDIMPLHVRAGSILPLGPDIQWATEKPADPIELRIYPGADAEFELYEDENDNYNYEKGRRAIIPIRWDDAAHTLTIGDRQGSFPGMLQSRTFNVVIVNKDHGVGVEPTEAPDKSVAYDGKAVSVKF